MTSGSAFLVAQSLHVKVSDATRTMGTVLRAAASSSSSRWTGVTSSSTVKKNKNNNAMVHHFRLKTNTTIITMRPRAASEDGDDGQVKWNTLESDGWVSEDPEPSPPPAGQVDEYERDARGRLSYVPRGFYYDAVRPDDEGDRLNVDVGVVGGKRQRTFVLRKILPSASDIVSVTYERPLGIVFERDTEGMVRVADFVEGSRAGKVIHSSFIIIITPPPPQFHSLLSPPQLGMPVFIPRHTNV